jgi:hypothetical protein
MSSRKLKSHLHSHARKRAEERYGIKFTQELRRRIIRAIQGGNPKLAIPVVKQTLLRTVFDVPIDGRVLRVVYDTKRHAIATFLPLEDETVKS